MVKKEKAKTFLDKNMEIPVGAFGTHVPKDWDALLTLDCPWTHMVVCENL